MFNINKEESSKITTNFDVEDDSYEDRRYFVYEIASQSYIILTSINDEKTAPFLQNVLWAPSKSPLKTRKFDDNKIINASNSDSQAIAFVYSNDIYYKPKVQGNVINRITKNGKYLN